MNRTDVVRLMLLCVNVSLAFIPDDMRHLPSDSRRLKWVMQSCCVIQTVVRQKNRTTFFRTTDVAVCERALSLNEAAKRKHPCPYQESNHSV
jgi:hypothetical protein